MGFNAHFDAVAKRPDDLISSAAVDAAMKNLGKGGAEISFQAMPGFEGIDEFEPSGWKIDTGKAGTAKQQAGENKSPSSFPNGVGMALMNGCFGSGYQKGDPCY